MTDVCMRKAKVSAGVILALPFASAFLGYRVFGWLGAIGAFFLGPRLIAPLAELMLRNYVGESCLT